MSKKCEILSNFHWNFPPHVTDAAASGRDALLIGGSSSGAANDFSVVQLSSSSDSSSSSNFGSSYNRRDMLNEIEETFNITNLSSINNSFRPTQHGSDGFFSITLDDFRNLTLNNIADDSSSDENNGDADDNGDSGAQHYADRHNPFAINAENSGNAEDNNDDDDDSDTGSHNPFAHPNYERFVSQNR